MALKLFRSTGYSSLLAPGETSAAVHPGWFVLAVSLWAGFVCNVALWRALVTMSGLLHALAVGTFVAAACALLLSLLEWRSTLKPAATAVLLLAALSACAIWSQGLPVDRSIAGMRVSVLIFPPWASLLRWQVLVTLAALAIPPLALMWNARVRRLSGPRQLAVNGAGMLLAAAALAATGFVLFRGLV